MSICLSVYTCLCYREVYDPKYRHRYRQTDRYIWKYEYADYQKMHISAYNISIVTIEVTVKTVEHNSHSCPGMDCV